MNKFSRLSACVIAVLTMNCFSGVLSQGQESEPVAPAESTESSTAPTNSENEGPVRPRRGKAPTADRIGGATVDINPDGTMTRRAEVLGRTVEGAEAPAAELPADPSYTPPTHATVSSSNEEPPVKESAAAKSETSPEPLPRGDYTLLAVAGACVVVGIVLWLTMRRPRKV